MRLELVDVSKRYGTTLALTGVSIAVDQGERVALVGPSGSGKTTLLRLAALLEEPSSGKVRLTLPEASTHPPPDIARRACLLLQKPVMLKRTVFENVAYAPRVRGEGEEAVEKRVAAALEGLEIQGLEDRYAPRLSGGQQQRVALARAIAARPELLLLDEFTANLDPANARVAENAVTRYQRETGASVLFATHNPQQAKRLAGRVALVLDGRLVEVAPTERFFSAPADPSTRAFLSGEIPY